MSSHTMDKSFHICASGTFGSYIVTFAPSSSKYWHTVIALDSRVSPVSFLKANPYMTIFLPDTVLNSDVMIFLTKRSRWKSLRAMTWCQYSATSGKFNDSARYVRLSTSFWKHEPPKPTDALRNFEPSRLSLPMAFATWSTSAPVASQMAEIAFIELILCAKKAFAASFDSSLDQVFVLMI